MHLKYVRWEFDNIITLPDCFWFQRMPDLALITPLVSGILWVYFLWSVRPSLNQCWINVDDASKVKC